MYALLSAAGQYGEISDVLTSTGLTQAAGYLIGFVLGVVVPTAGSVWLIVSSALVSTQADLRPILLSAMFDAGMSNVRLGFLFAGVIAAIYGID